MAQRVRRPHRGQSPSSVTQLPILTALHARYPTLFGLIIHHSFKKVNTFLKKGGQIFFQGTSLGKKRTGVALATPVGFMIEPILYSKDAIHAF